MPVYKELDEKEKIAIFQEHLENYMEMFNITTEELGKQLGVSRQQIYNLKSGYSKMSKAQWIAIRVILSNSEDVIKDRFRTEVTRKLQNLIERVLQLNVLEEE